MQLSGTQTTSVILLISGTTCSDFNNIWSCQSTVEWSIHVPYYTYNVIVTRVAPIASLFLPFPTILSEPGLALTSLVDTYTWLLKRLTGDILQEGDTGLF